MTTPAPPSTSPSIGEAISAAFGWWRDAGVDHDFLDEPRTWITPEAPPPDPRGAVARPVPPPQPAAPPPPKIGGDKADHPQDLGSFHTWWLTEPSLDAGMVMNRVPPRGVAGADLMVIVPEPEADDAEVLLSGPQGRLVDAMLRAMGIAPEGAYLASALPRHTPLPDWGALAGGGLGAVMCHHIALVAPQRILVLGGNILPLFGNDLPKSDQPSRHFNHEGHSIPLLAAPDPAQMLGRPRSKARLWRDWLEWTGHGAS